MEYWNKTRVLNEGRWPEYFLNNLVGNIPSIKESSHTKLIFNCFLHGDYRMAIAERLRGYGCPCCSKERSSKSRQLSMRLKNPFSEEFIQSLEGSPDKQRILDGSLKLHDYATFFCNEHGFYRQEINERKKGCRCPRCADLKSASIRSKSIITSRGFPDWFVDDIKYSPDRDAILNGEISMHSYARFYCMEHGIYIQNLGDHLYKQISCPKCANHYKSKLEDLIAYNLTLYGLKVERNLRTLIKSPLSGRGYELDIYLPEYRIAVEVDGLYWHSYERLKERHEDAVNYHLLKSQLCHDNEIRLIHLYSDELESKFNRCIDLILSRCRILKRVKIGARKCEFKVLSTKDRKLFYDENHIQGDGDGYTIALVNEGRILQAMSVRRAPSNTELSNFWELNRFATVSDVYVVGGFERLLKEFQRRFSITKWVSYADRRYSEGDLYINNGWVLDKVTPPDYKYIYKGVRIHKFNLRKDAFLRDPSLVYKDGLTELELAELNNIERIYDCGKLRYIKQE